MISVLDQHGIKGYEDTIPQLRSIYHLANWFVYPLSYFLTDTHNRCTAYYQRWQQFYETWQPANGSKQALPETLEEQKQALKQSWPKTYHKIGEVVSHIQALQDDPDKADAFFDQILDQVLKNPDVQFYDDLFASLAASSSSIHDVDYMQNYKQAKQANEQYAQNEFHKYLHKYAKKYLKSPQVQQFLDNYEDLITIVLTVLMTPQADPNKAMGHHGAQGSKAETMQNQQILAQDGQKDNQGNSVCVDHSAMLSPSDKMMKYVYKNVLFGKSSKAFQQFGSYHMNKGGDSDDNQ